MTTRRWQIAVWLVCTVIVGLGAFSYMRSETQSQMTEQMSRVVTALQNQTSRLMQTLEKSNIDAIPMTGQISSHNTNVLLIPEDHVLKGFKFLELEDLWMRYVENIQQACGVQRHLGEEEDGGYHVCERFITKDDCLVYSFGSRGLYQFEDDVAKEFGCEIHTFDPFDGQMDHQRSAKIKFHALGLSNKTSDKLLTLKSIKHKLNHSNKLLDILKIDIEGAEWESLPEIIKSGEIGRVKLLIVEFHLCLKKCKNKMFRTRQQYLTRLATLRTLYNLGFRLYYFRQWTMCELVDENKKVKTGCHEVHFMKYY